MLRDILTEAELKGLLSEEHTFPAQGELAGKDESKLLHALVRNQLRLMESIEELHAELRKIKSELADFQAVRETASGLEPLPLPFMKPPLPPADGGAGNSEHAPAEKPSRRERHKRRPFW